MLEIIPSPGTEDTKWAQIEKKIELVLPFIKTLHVDITDGKFIPHQTFLDPKPFAKYKDTLLLEVHFMTEEPLQYLKPFAESGFKRFIGQVEKMKDQVEFVAQGQLLGEVGLAVDGPTPLTALQVPYDDLDCLLFYTGEQAGHSGASFVPDRLDKIREVRKSSQIPIEVDGGITDQTVQVAREAGVTRFVSTGYIFGSEDPAAALKKLQSTIS